MYGVPRDGVCGWEVQEHKSVIGGLGAGIVIPCIRTGCPASLGTIGFPL